MQQIKLISTSALAKKLNIKKSELDSILLSLEYIVKHEDVFVLTDAARTLGADYLESKRFGRYIAWPENIDIAVQDIECDIKASDIGRHFDISARRVNLILSELGWIEKYLKGWKVTASGFSVGAIQKENTQSGIPFAEWSQNILENKTLLSSIQELKGNTSSEPKHETDKSQTNGNDFRGKFEARFRSTDGHFVRSKAEMLIDNALYAYGIVHAYERKLPIEEDVYCDFYLPDGNVYIEYWGYENDSKYLTRKKTKQDIYKKYNFKLIELTEKEVENLDDDLPRLLLKHGIQSY